MDMFIWFAYIQVALDIIGIEIIVTMILFAMVYIIIRLLYNINNMIFLMAKMLIKLDGVDQNFIFWFIGAIISDKFDITVVLSVIFVLYLYVRIAKEGQRRDSG